MPGVQGFRPRPRGARPPREACAPHLPPLQQDRPKRSLAPREAASIIYNGPRSRSLPPEGPQGAPNPARTLGQLLDSGRSASAVKWHCHDGLNNGLPRNSRGERDRDYRRRRSSGMNVFSRDPRCAPGTRRPQRRHGTAAALQGTLTEPKSLRALHR